MLPILLSSLALTAGPADDVRSATPEARAVAFLAREVPRWPRERRCFSCHNNGDGARALLAAARRGHKLPNESLTETLRWLTKPEQWEQKRGRYTDIDRVLTHIQFGATLTDAVENGSLKDRAPLVAAARLIAEDQAKDGSWGVDEAGSIGTPVTLGPVLATHLAQRTLRIADATAYRRHLERANVWLKFQKVQNVLDAAAMLLALKGDPTTEAEKQRRHCRELIRKGQGKDGGWGPYVTAPSEPFDTAVVLLALVREPPQTATEAMLRKGRAYLVASQHEDGSWPSTTRPAGNESYAQQISTAAWATQALLATSARR